MIAFNYEERISSFFLIERAILTNESYELTFNPDDKRTYLNFAENIIKIFKGIYKSTEYISNIETIVHKLENVYSVSMIEDYLQNNSLIANCFLDGGYQYSSKKDFPISIIFDFYNFFKTQSIDKQKIILNNIWQRLDTIKRIDQPSIDDLPF